MITCIYIRTCTILPGQTVKPQSFQCHLRFYPLTACSPGPLIHHTAGTAPSSTAFLSLFPVLSLCAHFLHCVTPKPPSGVLPWPPHLKLRLLPTPITLLPCFAITQQITYFIYLSCLSGIPRSGMEVPRGQAPLCAAHNPISGAEQSSAGTKWAHSQQELGEGVYGNTYSDPSILFF